MRELSRIILALTLFPICSVKAQQIRIQDPKISTPAIRALESEGYVDFAYLTPFPELLALPENASKDPIVVVHSTGNHQNRIGGASKDPNAWLQTLSSNSDAILIGRPYNRTSALTSTKTFVFSDYEFVVSGILKDKFKHIDLGSQIVVTRPGGVVSYEGRSLRAIDPEFQMFKLGELYFLFLHRLPNTGTYLVTAERAFLLQSGNVLSAKTHPDHAQNLQQKDFLSTVQEYVAREDTSK